ncbi:MAG: nickel pincer cofactor biosynthesis protein LarC [candidate division WOR-3 bacterium]
MKALYFDPISGASGDMILAALIDLGVSVDFLKKNLACITQFELRVKNVNRTGVVAKSVQFVIKKEVGADNFLPLLERSRLSQKVKDISRRIIERIFEVEKRIHGTRDCHLHELGTADTLLDVVGATLAIDSLGISKVYTGPLKAGRGFVRTCEGNMPAFNFATAQLLKGFPVEFLPIPFELTTPTGAAILSTIAEPIENISFKKIENIGIGTGTMDLKEYPNLLRTFIGELNDTLFDECRVIEANIDDQNPQDYEVIFEKLYKAGALEVFLTPVIMKNSRPGIMLTVLTMGDNQKVIDLIFQETTTLGVRMMNTTRIKLARCILSVPTPYGKIKTKIFEYAGKKRFSLEYQDLKKLSSKLNRPLRDLRQEITQFVQEYLTKRKPVELCP